MALRRQVYELLNHHDRGHRAARGLEIALVVLILANVVAVALETVPSFYARHKTALDLFDAVSVLIFTVEYIARIWSSVEEHPGQPASRVRLRAASGPMALVDLLAILPFYLSFLVSIDLRYLRVVRLLRVFKLTRYSDAMGALLDVLREEASSFLAALFILLVMLVLAASGAYLAEHRAQPDVFGSIPDALWWAIITLTSVGYGDVVPVTNAGKIFAGIISLSGVAVAALPAGIMASGLTEILRRRRDDQREEFRRLLEDGVVNPTDAVAVEELRAKMNISPVVATSLQRKALRNRHIIDCTCPSCGHDFQWPEDPTPKK